MSTMTQQEIVVLVQSFLDKHQPEGYRLTVEEQGIRQDDDLWYVTVIPDRAGVRAYDYAYHLTETEDEIRKAKSMNVLLVPTLVDD